jgi:ABC-type transporter Mla MlaB component
MTLLIRPSNDLDRHASGHFSAAFDSSRRITLTGELDITQLDALRGILDEALDRSGGPLQIDASDLSFIDQSAIAELLRYQLLAAARQRPLWLDPVSDPVWMLVDMFDLHHILGPMSVTT